MDSFLTMELFMKMRGNLINPIFSVIPLEHKFNFKDVRYGPLNLLSKEIEYVQRNLKRIGDEQKISQLFRGISYGIYMHAIDLGLDINEKSLISHEIYHDLISIYLKHKSVLQIRKEKYLRICDKNSDFSLENQKIHLFEELLKEKGFDLKTFNLSTVFLVLFWANLERLAKTLNGKTSVIKNSNGALCEIVLDEVDIEKTALLNLEVSEMIKNCSDCHMFIHYVGTFFVQNESYQMEFIESFGKKKAVKNTQAKGGKSKGETGQKLVEITRFFWKKCNKKELKISHLTMENFSDAIYSLCDKRRKVPNGTIRKIRDAIENLNEKEKIAILKRSKAKPKAIAARLSGFKK